MRSLISLLFLGVAMQACSAADTCNVVVHFIPLELELYQPPTPEYLEKHGDRVEGDLQSACALIKAARDSAKRTPLSGEDKRVRISITDDVNETVFISAERKVIFRGQVCELDTSVVDSAIREIVSAAQKTQDK